MTAMGQVGLVGGGPDPAGYKLPTLLFNEVLIGDHGAIYSYRGLSPKKLSYPTG